MAIPAKATVYKDSMDPHDWVEWIAEGEDVILEQTETIDSFTCILDSAAIALGISITTASPRTATKAPSRTNVADKSIKYWLEVDEAFQTNPAFDAGVKAAVTISMLTNANPPRRRQRTWVTNVEQL